MIVYRIFRASLKYSMTSLRRKLQLIYRLKFLQLLFLHRTSTDLVIQCCLYIAKPASLISLLSAPDLC